MKRQIRTKRSIANVFALLSDNGIGRIEGVNHSGRGSARDYPCGVRWVALKKYQRLGRFCRFRKTTAACPPSATRWGPQPSTSLSGLSLHLATRPPADANSLTRGVTARVGYETGAVTSSDERSDGQSPRRDGVCDGICVRRGRAGPFLVGSHRVRSSVRSEAPAMFPGSSPNCSPFLNVPDRRTLYRTAVFARLDPRVAGGLHACGVVVLARGGG